MGNIPVLMYHAIEDADHPAGAQDAGEQLYILQTEQFRQQMDYLHSKGYQTYLLEELQAMDAWPEKAVVLTFDDGHESNFTLALPILQQYGFKAHFFITTGWTGTPHFLTADQIKALHEAGMGIGSHGVTHRFLTDLNDTEIEFELDASKHTLQQILGKEIHSFSAPGGRIVRKQFSAAKELGYNYVCTSCPDLLKNKEILFDIPRFSIKADSTEYFERIVLNNIKTRRMILLRYNLLNLSKRLLGNTTYKRIHEILMRCGGDKSK